MTRIASASFPQATISSLLANQSQLLDVQRQVSSGFVAQDLQGFAADAGRLVSTQSLFARASAFESQANVLSQRLNVQAEVLTGLSDGVAAFTGTIQDAIAVNTGVGVEAALQTLFTEARSFLNTQFAGQFVFAGTQSETAPVQVASLADLAALPTAAESFIPDLSNQLQRISGSETIAAGPLADEVGGPLFAVLQRLQQFIDGPNGNFGAQLTDAQRTELTGILADLEPARQAVLAGQVQNGQAQAQTERALIRAEAETNVLNNLIVDQSAANLAELAVELNTLETQLQATASIFGNIQDLNLLSVL